MKKVILLLVMALCVSSLLAEVNFYGSLRTGWWYTIANEDLTGVEDESRLDFANKFYSNSRVGMNYDKENFTAKVELGLSQSYVTLRQAYGVQDFGDFKVLVGRTYSGFSDFAEQGFGWASDIQLQGYGMLYDGFNTQVKFTMPNGFYLALLEPAKMDFLGNGSGGIDAVIPKINAGMHGKFGDLDLHPTIGFAMSNYNEEFSGSDESIMAYAVAVTGKYDVSPLNLQAQVNFGQNIGNYGFKTPMYGNYGVAGWDYSEDEIINTTTMGGYIQATYENLIVGMGFVTENNDVLDDPDAAGNAFLQYRLKFGNLCLMPEVGMIDFMEDGYGNKQGSMLYFGTQMRVSIP